MFMDKITDQSIHEIRLVMAEVGCGFMEVRIIICFCM